jgi:thiamine biosynthesis lipoprotein
VITKPLATRLDFNAIAKGYGVDVISEFLESQGIQNYLVEIGGEIRSFGQNSVKNSKWVVGVQHPDIEGNQAYVNTLVLENESMATSGTYRKFKIDADGNRYTHIINTTTGYPSRTNILSVSVIAAKCMTADAYATALQAMGVEGIRLFLETRPELKVFIVFVSEDTTFETAVFNGFPLN